MTTNKDLTAKKPTVKVKTIDINAKEWFDRINGNSYFAGTVTVNYGMMDEIEFKMPFQYGYGSSYKYQWLKILINEGLINSDRSQDLRDQALILRASLKENCKQSELKAT